jgi:hypothetical protein
MNDPTSLWLTRSRLFARPVPAKSAWDIVKWWELRRVPYNAIVGVTGVLGGSLAFVLGFVAERRGMEVAWPDPPLFLIAFVVLYAIAANVCFTGGWISELLARRIWGARADAYGEICFCFGTIFSVLLTFLPGGVLALGVAIRLLWKL